VVDAVELLDLPAFKAKLQKQWVIRGRGKAASLRVENPSLTGSWAGLKSCGRHLTGSLSRWEAGS